MNGAPAGNGGAPSHSYVEHPMFVPWGSEHLASIITVPDAEPRGVVMLLQGLGAARSHKNRVWTRVARGLAARGIAAARMDYPAMGDSTGGLPGGLDDPPVREAETVIQMAMAATGVDRFGLVGNCMGARTAFTLASQHETCLTVAAILLDSAKPLLRGQGSSASGRFANRTAKRLPGVKRTVRRVLPDVHVEQKLRLLPDVEAVVRSRGGLFVCFGKPEVIQRFERSLVRSVGRTNGSSLPPMQVRSVDATRTNGFRIPVALQPLLIDSVVDWMDSTFPGKGSAVPGPTGAMIGKDRHE